MSLKRFESHMPSGTSTVESGTVTGPELSQTSSSQTTDWLIRRERKDTVLLSDSRRFESHSAKRFQSRLYSDVVSGATSCMTSLGNFASSVQMIG